MSSPETRVAFVSGDRLPGWVDRFAASHGALAEEELDAGLQLRAADGAVAVLRAPWPVDGRPGSGHDAISRLASLAGQARSIGTVLVRRGGYSVAVVSAGAVLASKTGTRHVQSRTAAGGWSQQRFARRRPDPGGPSARRARAPALRRPDAARVPGRPGSTRGGTEEGRRGAVLRADPGDRPAVVPAVQAPAG